MPPGGQIDVSAILTAVYRTPVEPTDHVATRVRARLALLETIGECARLLLEVPAFALTATLGQAAAVEENTAEAAEGGSKA